MEIIQIIGGFGFGYSIYWILRNTFKKKSKRFEHEYIVSEDYVFDDFYIIKNKKK